MSSTTEKEGSALSVLDIVIIFLKNKKRILYFTLFVCLVSIVLYFFIFDLIYISTASIKSSSKSSGLIGALEGGLPDIGGLDDIGLSGGKSAKELASYEEILISRRCLGELVKKFGLQERDDFKFLEDAIKDFRENSLILKQE